MVEVNECSHPVASCRTVSGKGSVTVDVECSACKKFLSVPAYKLLVAHSMAVMELALLPAPKRYAEIGCSEQRANSVRRLGGRRTLF